MHFLTHKFQSNFNWPCPNRSKLSDQDEVQFSVDAMSNAGRGGRKEQGGTWEKQTGDFPVRWLLPLKRPPCRCSLPRLSAFRFLPSSFVRLSLVWWPHLSLTSPYSLNLICYIGFLCWLFTKLCHFVPFFKKFLLIWILSEK